MLIDPFMWQGPLYRCHCQANLAKSSELRISGRSPLRPQPKRNHFHNDPSLMVLYDDLNTGFLGWH